MDLTVLVRRGKKHTGFDECYQQAARDSIICPDLLVVSTVGHAPDFS